MQNRELTYYSLLPAENLRHIERVADEMDQKEFITLGFEQKWLHHLWIAHNNEAFLDSLSYKQNLKKLHQFLYNQLKGYVEKCKVEYGYDDIDAIVKARKDWLKHTIFVCKNAYNEVKKEIFNEAVKWCESKEFHTDNNESLSPFDIEELVIDYVNYLDEHSPEPIRQLKEDLENSDDCISTFCQLLNEAIKEQDRESVLWLTHKHGAKENFRLMLEYINSEIGKAKSIERKDILAQSQETLIKVIIENDITSLEYFEEFIKTLKRREISGYPDSPRKLLQFHLNEIKSSKENRSQSLMPVKPKLTIDQIALKYVYEETQITRANANEIARSFGHNSGEKLFQRFTYNSSTANRKARPNPCTPKKLKNKISRLETVVSILSDRHKVRATDELEILKTYYQSEYE